MFPFPSIIQNIPEPLRRLRMQKLWLIAQDMAGVEEDVSRQIESIDEQIGQIEERARLFEKLWKIECEEAEELFGDLDDASDDVAEANHFERVTSDQGVIRDKNNNNKIKQEHEKVSLVAIPTRSATPSRIPTLPRINSDKPYENVSLVAIPTRSATPSRIPALPKTTSDNPPSLHPPLATRKISKIPTISTIITAAGPSLEKNTVPPSRLPESMFAHSTGSIIGRARPF